jgi:hypothetical protein
MVRHRLVTLRDVLLALPPAIVTVGLAIVACLEITGSHPLSLGPPRSVTEAIAMGDDAAALRLLDGGADVNEMGMIRSGVLFDRVVFATPVETAVLRNQAATLHFLVARGASFPREHLSCLAADVGARAVLPAVGVATCRAGAAWDSLVTRP